MTIAVTEIVIIAEVKIKGKAEDRIEVEINIGITPEMTEEIQKVIEKVIGKISTVETAETEGAKTTAVTEEAAEADLPAATTGIKTPSVVVTATSVMTEELFEIKKVIPEITLAAAITILLTTRNL